MTSEDDGSTSFDQTIRAGCRPLDDLTRIALRSFIENAVCSVFQVHSIDLRRPTRGRSEAAFARQVAMYLTHVCYGVSLSEVGRVFERDRTTVAHACAVIEDHRDDPHFDLALDFLDWILRQSSPLNPLPSSHLSSVA